MKVNSNGINMFGVNINPVGSGVDRAIKILDIAESNGLDLIGIQDHPYNPELLDAWTFLTFLVTRSKRLRFITTVSDIPLRPPAMLAKAATSLEIISNGRLELGIGAGAIASAIESYGGPLLAPGDAVSAFEEAIQVIRMLSAPRKDTKLGTFRGKFYHLNNVELGPLSSHYNMRLWVGNNAGHRMLKITGKLADGWIAPLQSYLPTSKIREAQRIIDDSAREAGRAPSSIRRLRLVAGLIDENGTRSKSLRGEGNLVVGTVQEWISELLFYIQELGLESFIFWPHAKDEDMELEQVMLFAGKIVPAVRKQL
jgi:alkanesulfonate monooxygenase SsuD/methylene tetrahydromethanopterin reductase-like flavin-dependent oxidoreductase (luciferase family)